MTQSSDYRSFSVFEQRVVAASVAQTLRYRAAYEELSLVREHLAADADRLAAAIEQRLIPRRTG